MRHRTVWAGALGALLAWPAAASAQAGEKADPAGGAAIGEVVLATGMALVVTAVALIIVVGHRSGRVAFVGKLAAYSERVTGVPGWASLPLAFVGGSLLVAVIGMYWDISLHIDNGRDPGPLANPAHYLILFGLFGIFVAGLLAMSLPKDGKPSATSVRLQNDWYAPLGGVLMTACAAFALAGFPLDDVWHRLFGQDVTLWGPTHLMLIGGASLATLASAILVAEGLRAADASGREPTGHFATFRKAMLAGAFLVGLSTVQAEFDFSVPQFRLLYHPVLLMLASSIALVTARIWIGRGGALLTLGGYLIVRGLLTGLVGGLWGQTTPHFPLYAAEALCVEAVALFLTTRRPIAFGAVAGAAIGTIGLAAEWGWSHVWMTMSWPSSLLPEGVIFGFLAAVSGGVIGAAIGRALAPPAIDMAPTPRWAVIAAGVGLLVAVAYPLPISDGDGKVTAQVQLTEAHAPPERSVNATVKLDPADAADDAEWFKATSWQGGGSIVVRPGEDRPRRVAHDRADPGVRQLEGHAAPAQGRRDRRPAGVPARGQGDPGQGGPGRGEHDPRVRARQEEPPARAEAGRARVPDHRRLPGRAADRDRDRDGAGHGPRPHGPRPRPRRPRAPRRGRDAERRSPRRPRRDGGLVAPGPDRVRHPDTIRPG